MTVSDIIEAAILLFETSIKILNSQRVRMGSVQPCFLQDGYIVFKNKAILQNILHRTEGISGTTKRTQFKKNNKNLHKSQGMN